MEMVGRDLMTARHHLPKPKALNPKPSNLHPAPGTPPP